MQPIGSEIRRRREALGYGLNRFALVNRIAPSHLSRIETGKCSNPSPEVMRRIANGLEVHVTEITNQGERTPWTSSPKPPPGPT